MKPLYEFPKTVTRPLRLLALLALIGPLSAQAQFTQLQKITPPADQRQAEARFGFAVAVDGDVMVVGARNEADGGAAYVFEKSGGTWQQVARLVASDRADFDQFGTSVAVSGSTVVVGAFRENEDAAGSNSLSEAGSAYVFEKSEGTWRQTQKLVASDRAEGDWFGYSVAVSGGTVVVGAVLVDINAAGGNTIRFAGSAYIFEKSGDAWPQTAKLVASDRAANDNLGISVAVSGSTVIVGADGEDLEVAGGNPLSDAGSAYVFEKSGAAWPQTAKLVASDRAELDFFGRSVAVSGGTVVVGAYSEDEDAAGGNTLRDAGSAYVFEKSGAAWPQTAKLVASDRATGDFFGFSVAVAGTTVVVGAFYEAEDTAGGNTLRDAGSAYVFEKSGVAWPQTQKLVADDRAEGNVFGCSVAASGSTVVVGAFEKEQDDAGGNTLSKAGSAYVFEPSCVAAFAGAPTVGGAPLCAGQALTLTFGAEVCGQEVSFKAQLSDATGSFASPTPLGTVEPGKNSVTIPLGTPAGAGYRVRVVSQSPDLTSDPSEPLTVTQPVFTQQPSVPADFVVCANATVSISFNVTCPANAGFTAELSNATGTFTSGTQTLGPVTPGMPNTLTIPGLTAPGSALYRIRIVGSNPRLVSDSTGVFRINALAFNSTPTVSLTPVCVGSVVKVAFTVQGNCAFLPGNAFTAELLHPSLSSPLSLGTVRPGLNEVFIPRSVAVGSGYRIQIRATAPGQVSAPSAAVTVNGPAFASTPTVSADNKCPGEAVRLSFSTTPCAFPAENRFRAELSNAAGSFASPGSLGTVNPGALNNVVIPVGTPAGTGYKLRIVSSNPALTSAVSGNFRVKACGNTREISPEENGLRVLVSPNPSPEGRLRISISGAEGRALRVALFNGAGQSLREQTIRQAGEQELLDWDIAHQPAGLYLLRVSSEREAKMVKVLH